MWVSPGLPVSRWHGACSCFLLERLEAGTRGPLLANWALLVPVLDFVLTKRPLLLSPSDQNFSLRISLRKSSIDFQDWPGLCIEKRTPPFEPLPRIIQVLLPKLIGCAHSWRNASLAPRERSPMHRAQFLSPLVVLVPSKLFCGRFIWYSAEGCRILTAACHRTLLQPHATRSSIQCSKPFETSPRLLVNVCSLCVL
jgi:hypothetical protein